MAFIFVVFVNACKKPLNTYEGKDSIYFNEAVRLPAFSSEVLRDSTVVSFSLVKAQDSIVEMVIKSTGAISTEDRPYQLVINPVSTLKEGVHFQFLKNQGTIKKNKLTDTLKLKFFRSADLLTNTLLLSFDLKENEHFVTKLKNRVINTNTGKKISAINYRWFVNDIIKKPARWQDGVFGIFTRKKLFLMASILNFEPVYLEATVSPGESTAYGKYMQRYLNEQKLLGNTILEEDGSVMSMGSSVQ
ncbi:protein of unknown function [Pedobacter rhizosphaerae]|uniref:DUF4843 domain-containing protein n=2 Tax=Pedobacter rhizosphaerae TaxID=390241 RepID=A0A1H9IXC6_9SPHI|nr:protein of unknown function [Pedobacter rhizosphaerae]